MPAEVEVGVKASPPKVDCQAPLLPDWVLVMVMLPAPLLMEIPVPAVKVAATGAAPVEPIRSWPLVKADEVMGEVPPPIRMPLAVKDVAPVPPVTTDNVVVAVSGEVPAPTSRPPAVKVVAPVPPLIIDNVEVEVTGLVPPPRRISPKVRDVVPVPPLTTEMVLVEVTAPVPAPSTKSLADRVATPVPPFATVKALTKVTAPVTRKVESIVLDAKT